jgi:hypothetical protein
MNVEDEDASGEHFHSASEQDGSDVDFHSPVSQPCTDANESSSLPLNPSAFHHPEPDAAEPVEHSAVMSPVTEDNAPEVCHETSKTLPTNPVEAMPTNGPAAGVPDVNEAVTNAVESVPDPEV